VSGSTFSQNNVSASYSGGGIYNQGTLSVAGSTFSSNTAGDGGGGISNYSGTLTVSNSTFSGNSANNGSGGAIYNGGPLTVIDSTFSGNSASFGGAIDDENTVTVSYSTFFDNTAPGTGGGAVFIDSSATATFKATLMVSNAPGNSCDSFNDSGILVSDGYNLEDGTTCNFTQSTDQSNATTAASYLGSLANNGGPTQTVALLSGSTAIDAIPLSACTDAFFNPVPTDQRGIYRPQGSGCDIGAFELTQTPSANVCPNGQGTPTPCSASIPLTYYVPAGTTLSSTTPVKVVTQGATGLDFAQVVVESCVASGRVKPNCSAAPAASARRAAERTRARASAQFSGVRPELISIGVPFSSGLQGPAYCDVLVTFTALSRSAAGGVHSPR